jgi:hypothetical protein
MTNKDCVKLAKELDRRNISGTGSCAEMVVHLMVALGRTTPNFNMEGFLAVMGNYLDHDDTFKCERPNLKIRKAIAKYLEMDLENQGDWAVPDKPSTKEGNNA